MFTTIIDCGLQLMSYRFTNYFPGEEKKVIYTKWKCDIRYEMALNFVLRMCAYSHRKFKNEHSEIESEAT